MGAGRRTVVECGPIHLSVTVVAFLLAIAVTFLLTYFLTRDHFKPKEEHKKDPEEEDDGPTAAELRLPTSIEPERYNLKLKTYLPSYVEYDHDDFTFEAEVQMDLKVLESVDKIVLSMRNLNISKEKSKLVVDDAEVEIRDIVAQGRLEKVEIIPARNIEKGQKTRLTLIYTGPISTSLGALYQTKYIENNTTKVAAVTQMEPTDARGMVPCFDEPAFKASWTVTVIHPKGTHAVSNNREQSEETSEDGKWLTTKFAPTPKMSSYLLALMVSEFEYITGNTTTNVEFRIWSRKEAKSMTKYALYAGTKCLSYYEKLYNYSFPLDKQDMVALPDFSAGAMENWGLVTYRENSLLYDENLYGPLNKLRVAYVVAHELAHQWFGDLVTMKWWEDLWLNEGFATYVMYLGTDEISDKKMRMQEYFLLDALTLALTSDSFSSSHPLSFKMEKSAEVFEAFDTVSYQKGGSVLRMLAKIIGQDKFDDGIRNYIKKFAYKNAEAADLYEAIDEIIAEDVPGPDGPLKLAKYANQWTKQMGYPIVTVKKYNDTHVELTQERYRQDPDAKDPERYANPEFGFKWDIPIWYTEGLEIPPLAWLKREEPLYLKINDQNKATVINADRHGFYRQNYDEEGWEKITEQLRADHSVYSPQTRNAIISDAFAAALIGKINYTMVFELLKYLEDERDYLPWEEALTGFSTVLDYFGSEPEAEAVQMYMVKLLKPIYMESSFEKLAANYKNDSLFFENVLEQRILEAYCSLGGPGCAAKYKKLFDEQVVDKCNGAGQMTSKCANSLAAPLRAKTYCYGIKLGNDSEFEMMMKLYEAESVALEKDILRRALGCRNDVTALKRLMLLALDQNSTFVRLQDVNDIFSAVASNPVGREIIFNFLIERWDQIYDGLMPEHRAIGRTIVSACSGVRSKHQIEQIQYLKKNGKHAKEFGNFDTAIEQAEFRIKWIEKNFRFLSNYFKSLAA
ncbi:unnamed protein product [Cylicocyclus nassatus]|uniref:Aminopeptidase n=1 Tax=Cylicocyclus nassatus TaxID=53992 RepID=A0AA36DM85_CYLNA|nr:unnamed protein product [Cylicocyclus nassatus]